MREPPEPEAPDRAKPREPAKPPEPAGSPENAADESNAADDALRRRLRAGDREAFAGLYERHAHAVYRHALRLTGDWSAAEDVMGETFLAAWQGRERLEEGRGSALPWLLGIATHKCENTRRGLRRRLAFLARQPVPAEVSDFSSETVSRLDDQRYLGAVSVALGQLRRQEREVLSLHVWSGLDYQQTADALGVPVGTVRSRLSRARGRLARLAEAGRAGTEPGTARGEVTHTAALAALPVREETR